MSALLAIDAGQTGVRGELLIAGRVVEQFEAPGVRNSRQVLPQLTELVTTAAATCPVDNPLTTVCAGVSALGSDETAAEWLNDLPASISQVVVAHDSITGYLAALGDQPGVVVACGTGVVTLAVGPDGVQRVDGWGYLLGDAGSGYWIGRAGLDLVMRAHDGRAGATSLSVDIQAEFPELEQMYLTLQRDEAKVSRIASYAKLVNQHAAAGDPGCQQILAAAGRELADSVVAGARRVGLAAERELRVGLIGMVFDSTILREAFQDAVGEHHQAAQFVRGVSRGLMGARRLAELPDDSVLAAALLKAGR